MDSATKIAPPEKATFIEASQTGENEGNPALAEDLVAPKPQRVGECLLVNAVVSC